MELHNKAIGRTLLLFFFLFKAKNHNREENNKRKKNHRSALEMRQTERELGTGTGSQISGSC